MHFPCIWTARWRSDAQLGLSRLRGNLSHRHTRSPPGPPAAAWSWIRPVRRWGWETGTENGRVMAKGRRRSLHPAHHKSGRREGWRGDSADSTTAFWWSAACPSWHSAACGLDGDKGGFVHPLSPLARVCVCACLTQGRCVGALGGNGERDNEVRSRGVAVNPCGTASSELQHAVDNLHDLSGATHGPAHTDAITRPGQ